MSTVTRQSTHASQALEWAPLELAPEVQSAMSRLLLRPLNPEGLRSFIGRNDNWAGRTDDGRSVLVKRLAGVGQHERYERSMAYERLAGTARFRFLRSPRLIGADERARVLVHELISDATLANDLAGSASLNARWCRRIGHAIGELHSVPIAADEQIYHSSRERVRLIHDLDVDEYAESTGASLDAWGLLHHDRQLAAAIDRLTEESAAVPKVHSHGDLRFDQLLVRAGDTYIVDWEEFRAADPALDVGAMAGCWLLRAVTETFAQVTDLEIGPGETHEAVMAKGDQQLEAVRPLVATFWYGYREAHRLDPGSVRELAVRATAYAGLHLLDRMLASSVLRAKLGAVQRAIAGIGRAALVHPERHVEIIGLGGE